MTQCPNCQDIIQQIDAQPIAPFCAKCRFPIKLINGVYRLEKRLGTGGFGVVYLARHIHTQEQFAIKLLRNELFEQLAVDPDFDSVARKQHEILSRFQQEIRVTAELSQENPHIVKLFDLGDDVQLGHYYIMEYLSGDTLETALPAGVALPYAQTFTIFQQLCRAISGAHRRGIVHRDLKPSNIFLQPTGSGELFVKVIDFGIAKSLFASQGITLTQGVLGSMTYLSPEQGRSEVVDQRTDIYALGGIFYRLMTGTPPFLEEGATALLLAHLNNPFEPMTARRPDLDFPPGLDQVIFTAMAKQPQNRFPDVESFWEALEPFSSYVPKRTSYPHENAADGARTIVEGMLDVESIRMLRESAERQGIYLKPVSLPPPPPPLPDSLSYDEIPIEDEDFTMLSYNQASIIPRPPTTPVFAEESEEIEPVFEDEFDPENFLSPPSLDDEMMLAEEFESTPVSNDSPHSQTQLIPSPATAPPSFDELIEPTVPLSSQRSVLPPRRKPQIPTDTIQEPLLPEQQKLLTERFAQILHEEEPTPTSPNAQNPKAPNNPTKAARRQTPSLPSVPPLRENPSQTNAPPVPSKHTLQENIGEMTELSMDIPLRPSSLLTPPAVASHKTIIDQQLSPEDLHTLSAQQKQSQQAARSAFTAPAPPPPLDLSETSETLAPLRPSGNYPIITERMEAPPSHEEMTGPTTRQEAPKKTRIGLILFVFLLLLSLGVGVGMLIQSKSKSKTDPSRPTPPSLRTTTPLPKTVVRKRTEPFASTNHPAGKQSAVPGLPEAKVVWIPPGEFMIGSGSDEIGRYENEGPQTTVRITRGFWMWQTEVTQAQYQAVMGQNPAKFKSCGLRCPVEQVSWHQALQFSNQLSQKLQLEPCFECQGKGKDLKCEALPKWQGAAYPQCPGYRLPTEAEWEYAARAGTNTALYTGTNDIRGRISLERISAVAWFAQNSEVKYPEAFRCDVDNAKRRCGTVPVAQKTPNAWGLYDILGNVWEWCYDWYHPFYPKGPLTDYVAPVPTQQDSRIGRGGSWHSAARLIRIANRGRLNPTLRYSSIGLRVVRTGP